MVILFTIISISIPHWLMMMVNQLTIISLTGTETSQTETSWTVTSLHVDCSGHPELKNTWTEKGQTEKYWD